MTYGAKLSDAMLYLENKKMYRTPTTMDSKEDSLKHATKMLQGKTTRASGERVQITLADQMMIEEIKKNPELMKVYQDHTMVTRKNLPPQKDFVTYLKSQISVAQLIKQVEIKKTTIEHWFRNDKCFSYPTPEDWEMIKPHLKEIKYDHEMTTLYPIEWTPRMYPTPSASCQMDVVAPPETVTQNKSGWTVTRKNTKTKFGAKLNDVVNKLQHEGIYPTPTNSEHKYRLKGNSQASKCLEAQSRKAGGKLNPNFVEFLMGYPTGWTKIE
jgi:hypothetical protein